MRHEAVSTRVDEACAALSRRIREEPSADGWLPPERELAEQLGVSRTVVREATKRLELQGLLEVRHGVGLKVVDRLHSPLVGSLELLLPDAALRLEQLCETRRIVEPELARLAAERARPAHRERLRRAQENLAAAVETVEAIEADLEFHRGVAQAAGNRILELLLESLADLGRDTRRATLATTGFERAHEHHAEILRAIENRRPQAAADAMRRHVEEAGRDLQAHLRRRLARSKSHAK
jgi:GntR family transcriptional repressor for pyruvate dehydrogenase complex